MLSHDLLILLVQVTFHLPAGGAPVIRADTYAASDLSRPFHSVEVDAGAGEVVAALRPGLDAIVVLRCHDGQYYLHGPFRWPSEARTIVVDATARRTVEGGVTADAGFDRQPSWVDADGSSFDEWPRCAASGGRWACIGVPAEATGVVALKLDSPVLYAVVRPSSSSGSRQVPVRSARWATIISLEGAEDDLETARVQLLAPRSSPARTQRTRVMLESAAGSGVERLSRRSYLASGSGHQDELLLQTDGKDVALARVPLATMTVTLLERTSVLLTPAVPTAGRVVDSSGGPAVGARLALAELLERPGPGGRMRIVKRQVAELESGAGGEFTLRGLGAGRFELLALHPRLGRGALTFEPGGRPLLLRLERGRRVGGRVTRNGVPLPAVWVDVPASHDEYLAASDPMDVLAPASTTGADGRFQVVLPQRGATELRLDYGGVVTRLPLPDVADGAAVDVGDIALHGGIAVRVAYAGDARCALVAAGPLGHTGMTLAEAQVVGPGARLLTLPEAGRWLLELRCPRGTWRAEPSVVDVPAEVTEWSVHVTMAPP